MEYVLNVRNLTKKYGSFKALDGLTRPRSYGSYAGSRPRTEANTKSTE